MKRYPKRLNITEAFQVVGFIPPEQMVRIADERTAGMAAAFTYYGAKAAHVNLFARSCYMQGVNDAADALARVGALKK